MFLSPIVCLPFCKSLLFSFICSVVSYFNRSLELITNVPTDLETLLSFHISNGVIVEQ